MSEDSAIRILLVDDDEDEFVRMRALTRQIERGATLEWTTDFDKARALLESNAHDLALIDYQLGARTGLELIHEMSQPGATPTTVPLIMLTGVGSDKLALSALRAGAADYLEKSALSVSLLQRAIRYAMERTKANNELRRLALYDHLTGLAGRALIHDRLGSEIARERRAASGLAVLFIDLDRFKHVNDSLGHDAGDTLLREVSKRIAEGVRECDTIGRLGGDEFIVALPQSKDLPNAISVANRLLEMISRPYFVDGHEVQVSASIGVSVYPTHGDNADALLKSADLAMYAAKDGGKRRVHVFAPEMADIATRRLHLESTVREAWRKQEFSLMYQPIYDLETRKLRSVEALMRWLDKSGKPKMGPLEFLPVLDDLGVAAVTGWVVEQACLQMAKWRAEGILVPCVSVNISPDHLCQDRLVPQILDSIAKHGMSPGQLEVEVTENAALKSRCGVVLRELSSAGVRLALDDFGTGFSGLSTLRDFPFSAIKLDRSFISAMHISSREQALVQTMVLMGTTMALEVVAEGIETEAELTMVANMGATSGQGYFLSRPLRAGAVAQLLSR
jgi:diguanylate cyclase